MEKHDSLESSGTVPVTQSATTNEPQNEPQDKPEHTAKEDHGSTTEDSSEPNLTATKSEEEWEYITGVKLFLVIGTVTLACFIMLLDTSIVATASQTSGHPSGILTDFERLFQASQATSIPSATWAGMAALT
jgi:hypothetical protein